jgi:hypothetical protein
MKARVIQIGRNPKRQRLASERYMKTIKLLCVLAQIWVSASAACALERCPVSDEDTEKAESYVDAVKAAVQSAPNCSLSYKVLEGCQLGTTEDNELSDIVISKCEPLFVPRASDGAKKKYKEAQARCNRIAETNEGTIYQSASAVCLARISRNFASKAGYKP